MKVGVPVENDIVRRKCNVAVAAPDARRNRQVLPFRPRAPVGVVVVGPQLRLERCNLIGGQGAGCIEGNDDVVEFVAVGRTPGDEPRGEGLAGKIQGASPGSLVDVAYQHVGVGRRGGERRERRQQQREDGEEKGEAGAGTPGARLRPGAASRRRRRAGRGGGGRLRRADQAPGARHARWAAGPLGRWAKICAASHPGKKNRYSASYRSHRKVNETRELRTGNGTLRARVRVRSTIGSGNGPDSCAWAVDSRIRASWLWCDR